MYVRMLVGLVNMNPSSKQEAFVETLRSLQCIVRVIHSNEISEKELVRTIRESDIRKWIFTGSPANVYDLEAKIVPAELLDLNDKSMFFICYSMESVLKQLGYSVLKRDRNIKEEFVLQHSLPGLKNPATLYRNHQYYTPAKEIQCLAEYNGEAMIYFYKNSCMTQFHPEKTDDGKQMLFVWLFQ